MEHANTAQPQAAIPVARSLPLDDHYVNVIGNLAEKAHAGETLSNAEAELVLLAVGPLCKELLLRRKVMTTIAQVAEQPNNVTYIADHQKGGET